MPPTWIKKGQRRYNDHLRRVDESTLKRMTRLMGLRPNLRRDQLIDQIAAALDEPERMAKAIHSMDPSERSILAILADLGGEAEETVLRAAAYGGGLEYPGSQSPQRLFHEAVVRVVRTGLVLNWNDYYSLTHLNPPDYGFMVNTLFSDDRILAQAGRPVLKDPALPAVEARLTEGAGHVMSYSPHLVTMQLVALLQSLEQSGGIGVTQAGVPRALDLRKVAKAVNWPDGGLQDGPLSFPAALQALVGALRAAGVLKPGGPNSSRLVITPEGRAFGELPVHAQARALLLGMVPALWEESGGTRRANNTSYSQVRAALLYLLTSLPAREAGPFYAVDALDQALFNRIALVSSLSNTLYRPAIFDAFAHRMETRAITETLLAKLRREWLANERKWLDSALASWLYFLGVVELAVEGGAIRAVRLTALGRAALHPELKVLPESAPRADAGPAWVIQPNFDLVAYLERLSTAQLAFLERHAERRSAQQHLAEYRLTRDSVYRGLESGTRPDDLLEELARGSGREVPQNVAAEIREWATQRERITLYRRASLAEFPSESQREKAIRAGLAGAPAGERFLLIPNGPNRPLTRLFKHTVNYDQAPQRNLLVSEEGVITYHHPNPDLLLQARLEAWSEPHPASGGRVFTRQSVQAASAAGLSVSALLKLIDERQYRILPSLVRISLRAWTGEKFNADLQPVTILRTASSELTYAFQNSELLRPYLISTVTPGIFLVRPEQVEELRALLRSLGLESG